MMRYYLTIHIRSDATFGRGAGVAGLVDVEIEHDQYGCPFIGGRALKGLLVEEWANLRYAVDRDDWDGTAAWLFGTTGDAHAHMHVGAATLPADLREAIHQDKISAQAVLNSLTTIRRQTAMDAVSGAPERAALRAMRVLLRGTELIAPLDFDTDFEDKAKTLGLLAACALAVRRGGTGRNRGRGRIRVLLHEAVPDDNHGAKQFTLDCFEAFQKEVRR